MSENGTFKIGVIPDVPGRPSLTDLQIRGFFEILKFNQLAMLMVMHNNNQLTTEQFDNLCTQLKRL